MAFRLSLGIRARQENSSDSAAPLQHSAETMDRSPYQCVRNTATHNLSRLASTAARAAAFQIQLDAYASHPCKLPT